MLDTLCILWQGKGNEWYGVLQSGESERCIYCVEQTMNQKGYFTSTVLHQHLLGANAIVQQDSSVFDGLDVTVTVTAEPKG